MLQPKDRAEYNDRKIPPTYELIADFPSNKDFQMGKLIELIIPFGGGDPPVGWCIEIDDCQGVRCYTESFFEMYPHLFRNTKKESPSQIDPTCAKNAQVQSTPAKKLQLEELSEPIGNFIIEQEKEGMTFTELPDGHYYHYAQVCKMLAKVLKSRFSIPQSGAEQILFELEKLNPQNSDGKDTEWYKYYGTQVVGEGKESFVHSAACYMACKLAEQELFKKIKIALASASFTEGKQPESVDVKSLRFAEWTDNRATQIEPGIWCHAEKGKDFPMTTAELYTQFLSTQIDKEEQEYITQDQYKEMAEGLDKPVLKQLKDSNRIR